MNREVLIDAINNMHMDLIQNYFLIKRKLYFRKIIRKYIVGIIAAASCLILLFVSGSVISERNKIIIGEKPFGNYPIISLDEMQDTDVLLSPGFGYASEYGIVYYVGCEQSRVRFIIEKNNDERTDLYLWGVESEASYPVEYLLVTTEEGFISTNSIKCVGNIFKMKVNGKEAMHIPEKAGRYEVVFVLDYEQSMCEYWDCFELTGYGCFSISGNSDK